jgi:hypothetical protein
MPSHTNSLLIKIAIAVAIVAMILVVIKKNQPKPSLIPAKEGFEGDGLPEYEDVEYLSEK